MIKVQNMKSLVGVDLVSIETFKKLHSKEKVGGLDRLVADITSVERLEDGYSITTEQGNNLRIKTDGSFSKDNAPFTFSFMEQWSGNRDDVEAYELKAKRPRVVNFNGYNSSLYMEKLFGICEQWLSGVLPKTFRGLQVNMMDNSGNLITAKKLGIKYNLDIDNLEWCIQSENTYFGKQVINIARMTGGVYRFSCMDAYLKELIQLKNKYVVKDYMDKNYERLCDYVEDRQNG